MLNFNRPQRNDEGTAIRERNVNRAGTYSLEPLQTWSVHKSRPPSELRDAHYSQRYNECCRNNPEENPLEFLGEVKVTTAALDHGTEAVVVAAAHGSYDWRQ